MRSVGFSILVGFVLSSPFIWITLARHALQPVGCDHQLGSDLKPDACGVCGGDNSTCLFQSDSDQDNQHSYEWIMGKPGPCIPKCSLAAKYQITNTYPSNNSSLTTNTGLKENDEDELDQDIIWPAYQMSKPFCLRIANSRKHLLHSVKHNSQLIEKLYNLQVSEHLCDADRKPNVELKKCQSAYGCPAKWIIKSWSNCDTNCGTGQQKRSVYCGLFPNTRSKFNKIEDLDEIRMDDTFCSGERPKSVQTCNSSACPKWFQDEWSSCSVNCGHGQQTRVVLCQDSFGQISFECDLNSKPETERPCFSNCTLDNDMYAVQNDWISSKVDHVNHLTSEPNFIVGQWNDCSSRCGQGHQTRTVQCQMILEFSQSVVTLPDEECSGSKPIDRQICFGRNCSNDDKNAFVESKNNLNIDENLLTKKKDDISVDQLQVEVDMLTEQKLNSDRLQLDKLQMLNQLSETKKPEIDSEETNLLFEGNNVANSKSEYSNNLSNYKWATTGFSQCTASCLGGVQESIIECVEVSTNRAVSPFKCDFSQKPDSLTRTCNDHPCPPRWNVSDFGPCSKECGGGSQIRSVNCIHEITRGTDNVIKLSNADCPTPMPPSRQFCNVRDCPAKWQTEKWGPCDKTCGKNGSYKTRKVYCIKEMAFGQIVRLPDMNCDASVKPVNERTCLRKQCKITKSKKSKVKTASKVKNKDKKKAKERWTMPLHYSEDGKDNVLEDAVANERYIDENTENEDINLHAKYLSIRAHGSFSVLEGKLIKLRCPRNRAWSKQSRPNQETEWTLNGQPLNEKHFQFSHFEFTNAGSLKIINTTSKLSGVYICRKGEHDLGRLELEILDKNENLIKNISNNKIEKTKSIQNETIRVFANTNEIENGIYKFEEKFKKNKQNLDNQLTNDNPDVIEMQDDSNVFQSDSLSDIFNSSSHHIKNEKTNETKELEQDLDYKLDSSSSNDLQSSLHQLAHLRKLLTKLLTRKSEKSNFVQNIQNNHLDDLEEQNIASNIVNTLSSNYKKDPQLLFDWIISEWSSCSMPCGNGFQIRALQCIVQAGNNSKPVEEMMCLNAGLARPTSKRKCQNFCATWKVSRWSMCQKCIKDKIGIKTRIVECVQKDGAQVDDSFCSHHSKPKHKKRCLNLKCFKTDN